MHSIVFQFSLREAMPMILLVIVLSVFSQCVFHEHIINMYDYVNILRIFAFYWLCTITSYLANATYISLLISMLQKVPLRISEEGSNWHGTSLVGVKRMPIPLKLDQLLVSLNRYQSNEKPTFADTADFKPSITKGSLCYWNKIFVVPALVPVTRSHARSCRPWALLTRSSTLLSLPTFFAPHNCLGNTKEDFIMPFNLSLSFSTRTSFLPDQSFSWDFSPHRILLTEFPVSISQTSPSTKILH